VDLSTVLGRITFYLQNATIKVKRNTAILANKTRKAMVISDKRIVSII